MPARIGTIPATTGFATRVHYTDCDQPGALAKHFVEENQKAGMASLVTLPMAGYVAADKNGAVGGGRKGALQALEKSGLP